MKNILLLFSFLFSTTQADAQGSIIFAHEEQGEQGIYIIDSRRERPQFLTKGDLPTPSPNGYSFAYVFPDSKGTTKNRSIRIMDIATGNSRELVGMSACYPRWSPRGDKILFECYGEKFQVWIADTNGRNVKMLLNNAQNPAWVSRWKALRFHPRL